jgi:DNA-binding NarL/FixJ family response regulator
MLGNQMMQSYPVNSDRKVTMVRTSQPVMPTHALRSCCRCGKEFRSASRELVCSDCRKPKANRDLSFREKQIVALVRQAKANKEIAYELHLSEGTVKEYLNRIFRKLEVKSRTELAVWAMTLQ